MSSTSAAAPSAMPAERAVGVLLVTAEVDVEAASGYLDLVELRDRLVLRALFGSGAKSIVAGAASGRR